MPVRVVRIAESVAVKRLLCRGERSVTRASRTQQGQQGGASPSTIASWISPVAMPTVSGLALASDPQSKGGCRTPWLTHPDWSMAGIAPRATGVSRS